MPETTEHYVTREELEIALTRLENKLDARFNAIDARFNAIDKRFSDIDDKFNGVNARFNNQRTLLWGIALGVVAQIVNAWILHAK